jgi:hypothetical protein
VLGEDGKNIKKRLINADGSINVRGQEVPNLKGKVSNTVLQIEYAVATDTSASGGVSNATPGKVPIVKRRKQGGEVDGVDSIMSDEAASVLEDRRVQ